jgi:hypothetical protein
MHVTLSIRQADSIFILYFLALGLIAIAMQV